MADSAGSRATRDSPRLLSHGAVVLLFAALFAWLYSRFLFDRFYLVESDLYEYFLPIFLSPATRWSHFEFAGVPAFADPGEALVYPVEFLFSRVFRWWAGFAIAAHLLGASFTYAYIYSLTKSVGSALVAGLAFGLSEAMVERLAHMAFLHSIVWLPLILLALDRLRETGKRRWFALGVFAVAGCILSGHPQPPIYISILAVLYGLTGGVAERARSQYFLRILAIFALGGLVAGIKLIPFIEATTQMAREDVNFGQFVSHSNTPAQMWSTFFPTVLHDGREAPTYVGLATLVFALVGVFYQWRHWRTTFFLVTIIVTTLLGMGEHTPLARWVYDYVPFYNKFRVSGRHLFMATFAIVALAGVGLDAVLSRKVSRVWLLASVGSLAALMLTGLVFLASPHEGLQFEVRYPLPWSRWGLPPVIDNALWTQVALSLLTIGVTLGVGFSRRSIPWVSLLAIVLVADLVNAQPFAVSRRGWNSVAMPREAAQPTVHAQRLAAELAPLHQRVLALGGSARDAIAPGTWARIWNIPSASGYGPMLMDRHNLLSTMGRNGAPRPSTLSSGDAALDLLAVKYVLVKPDEVASQGTFDRDELVWEKSALGLSIGRPDCGHRYPSTRSLWLPQDVEVATLSFVSYLRCLEDLKQGSEAAVVSILAADGETYRQPLRAGVETAEAALNVPSVLARAGHQPARRFDDPDISDHFAYLTTITLPKPARLKRLDIQVPGNGGWLVLDRLTLIDGEKRSYPQVLPQLLLRDTDRWGVIRQFRTSRRTDRGADEDVADEDEYTVYENRRALPRAWMVTTLVALELNDMLQAVRTSRLPDGRTFDARTMALLEKSSDALSKTFPTGTSSVDVESVGGGQVSLNVSSEGGGFVVLSETHYPGWRARIDGVEMPVSRTDVSLQGVEVPAGRHRVVFEFRPLSLYVGAVLSIVGVGLLVLLSLRRRWSPLWSSNGG